jgi:RimJ/RimL family protein N-acetyltransferase
MLSKESEPLHEELTRDAIFKGIINELNNFHLPAKEYINLASSILDLATKTQSNNNGSAPVEKITTVFNSLPIEFEELKISELNYKKHKKIIQKWIEGDSGSDFIHSRIDDIEFNAEEFFLNKKNIFGLIETENQPIGLMGFLHYDDKNNKAELRKIIGEKEFRGKGLGKKSTQLWLDYGLHGLKLRKIYLYTFDTNLRNIRINREMGFQLEGVFKQENVDNNVAKDIIRMAYLI